MCQSLSLSLFVHRFFRAFLFIWWKNSYLSLSSDLLFATLLSSMSLHLPQDVHLPQNVATSRTQMPKTARVSIERGTPTLYCHQNIRFISCCCLLLFLLSGVIFTLGSGILASRCGQKGCVVSPCFALLSFSLGHVRTGFTNLSGSESGSSSKKVTASVYVRSGRTLRLT